MKRAHRYILVLCLLVVMVFAAAPGNLTRKDVPENPFETSAQPSSLQSVDASWSSLLASEIGLIAPSLAGHKGRGITIGVVDTGIDGSVLTSGSLIDWVDLTGEGEIRLSEPIYPSSSGTLSFGDRTLQVSGIPTKSGRLRVGTFLSSALPADAPLRESAGSGLRVAVVAADRYIAGQYDTVYVDTDGDGSLGAERGLEVFRNSGASVLVRLPNGRHLQVVVSDILDNGRRIVLGFDGHGHGTSVASILRGNAGGLTPLVPEARLVSVKAVDSSGRTRWDLLAQGILTACKKGAKIVIMSVAPLIPGESSGSLNEAIRKAEKDHGALVVVASGNKGPGLSTLPDYAELPNVLSVGAYIPPSAGQALGIVGGRMWPWSSIGPTSGGATVSLVAPAMGPAQVPSWAVDRDRTWLFEGTSCAAAYAGGSAVALASAQVAGGIPFSAILLKEALEDAAKPLPDASAVEQGSGVLNSGAALEILKAGRRYPRVRAVAEWRGEYLTSGFFDRDRTPGFVPFGVDSFLPFDLSLSLGLPAWATADTVSLSIPAVEQRDLGLRIDTGLSLGLTSGFVTGDDSRTPGTDMKALATILVPRWFGESGSLTIQKVLQPSSIHREYIRIDPGAETLSIALEVPKTADGKPRGRERLYVYDDRGWLVHEGPWIGAGSVGVRDQVDVRLPGSGVWETVVVSDPASEVFGVAEASFRLTFTKGGLAPTGAYWPLTIPPDASQPATGEIRVFSPSAEFQCRPTVIEPGKTGEVSVERLMASSSVSMPKSVTGVTEGTRYLHLSVSEVSDPAADIDIYLYHLDKTANRWAEVKASAKAGSVDEALTLMNPTPGQYIAYIEVKGLRESQTTFKWTTVIARDQAGYQASEVSTGSTQFAWPKGSDRTIRVLAPNRFSPTKENRIYLALWDDTTGALRNLIPLTVTSSTPSIVAYAGTGSSVNGRTMVTLSAWDSATFKPVDALVRLGDVWFQLRNGKAITILNKDSLEGLELYAEHPGRYPKQKTIHE